MSVLFPSLLSFLATMVVLVAWLKIGAGMPMDHSNERSLHVGMVPRVGGIAMAAGIVVGISGMLPVSGALGWMVTGALGLFVLSVIDDMRSLPVILRMLGHVAAASLFVWALRLPWNHVGPAILALAWMTNLYNFMDGADGLAGGMTVIGFGAYGIAAAGAAPDLASLCLVIAAAACAFLLFNFPPAKVFMGDAGSIPLGFLAAAVGFLGCREDVWPWWFPILVFSPFIADATVTLGRRLYHRERVWQAHRDHYYQRLVLSGLSHRQLAIAAWLLMIGVAASALGLRRADAMWEWGGLVAWSLAFGFLFLAIGRRSRPVQNRLH